VLLKDAAYQKESFPSKESDSKLFQSIFRLKSRHHQLIFKWNLLRKDC